MEPLTPGFPFLTKAASIVLSAVSQTAGRAAGGTVITVTGSGINGTPTSTLGAVSGVTGTGFTITTNAHAAGTFAWSVTNGDGTVVTMIGITPLHYVYLSPPIPTAIAPNNGPATLPANLTFTITNLPPAGSGCPVSITLGTGTSSSLVITGSSTCTATMSAVGSDPTNCTVTVDGVSSAATAGLYTSNPAPVITSIGIVGIGGGNTPLSGAFFAAGITATIVIGGVPTATPIAFISSTSATLTVPALAAGNYTVNITNTGTDGQTGTSVLGLQVSSVTSPEVIFTTDLLADWDFTKSTHTGASFTSCPDQSGHGNTLGKLGSPVFNAVDPDGNYGGQPSVSFDGSSSGCVFAGLPFSGNALTSYVCGYVYATSASTQTVMAQVLIGTQELIFTFAPTTDIPFVEYSTAPPVNATSPYIAIPFIAVFADVGSAGTVNALSLSMNGQTPANVIGSTNPIPAASTTVSIGNQNGSAWVHMTVIRAGVIQRAITSVELSELVQFLNLTHQVDRPPQLAVQPGTMLPEITNLKASSVAQFRVAGSNFATSGVTASVNIGGTRTTLTIPPLEMKTDSLGFTGFPATAAGTPFDLTITNPDGGGMVQTIPGSFVTTAPDPMTEGGLSCMIWTQDRFTNAAGSTSPVTGDSIKLAFNKALLSTNTPVQATSSKQPIYTAVNALFNNQPTVAGIIANSTELDVTAMTLLGNTTDMWAMTVARTTVLSASFQYPFASGNASNLAVLYQNEIPFGETQATFISWGTSVGTAVHELMGRHTTSTNITGINVDNGVEVTGSVTQPILDNTTFNIFGRIGTQFLTGEIACVVVWTAQPPSLANIHTFAQTLGAP